MHGWARSAGRTVASATQQHKRVVVARWAHQRLEGIDGAESVARQAEPAQVQQAGILKCLERAVDELIVRQLERLELWQRWETLERGEAAAVERQHFQIDEFIEAAHFGALACVEDELLLLCGAVSGTRCPVPGPGRGVTATGISATAVRR